MPLLPLPRLRYEGTIRALLLGFAVLFGATSVAVPAEPTEENQRRVQEVVATALTGDALNAYAEGSPAFCADVPPDSRICSWYFNNRRTGWKALAQALDTRYQITLVCRLPSSGGGERGPDACRAYPKHYEANDFGKADKMPSRADLADKPYLRSKSEEQNLKNATTRLADAQTLWELIDLVGAGPRSCRSHGEAALICEWSVTTHQIGYNVIRVLVPENRRARSQVLECLLPADGRERAEDSCQVR